MANKPIDAGITVYTEYILSEGIEAVLDSLERARATIVAVCPRVAVPCGGSEGEIAPPSDADSSVREFDRPLWNRTSLRLRYGPTFAGGSFGWSRSRYQLAPANDLTRVHGSILGRFIDSACMRGLKVYLQVGAASPPSLHNDDRPRLPDGKLPAERLADTASLASPDVHEYVRGFAAELLSHYPRVNGIRIDWPETPCYTLGEGFLDFSQHVARFAAENNFDYGAIRASTGRVWRRLNGGLSNTDLERLSSLPDTDTAALAAWWPEEPMLHEWLRLKRALSVRIIGIWREALNSVGPGYELSANSFMPPFSCLSGFDFESAGGACQAVAPKFYTMHWLQIARFWSDHLLRANTGLDPRLLTRAIARLWQLDPVPVGAGLDHFRYPRPDEHHAVSNAVLFRNLDHARRLTPDSVALTPIVHGYGPLGDFARRFGVACREGVAAIWVNRYGYLSDAKLDVIGSRPELPSPVGYTSTARR